MSAISHLLDADRGRTLIYTVITLLSSTINNSTQNYNQERCQGYQGRSTTKVKKTVQQMSDSDSKSLLGPDRPEQRPEGSKHEEGEEGEGARERQAPEDTQEEADPDEEDGAPTRKRAHVSDNLTVAQKHDLVDFFSNNPLLYDQTLKEFKMRSKRDHMLDTKAKEMGLTGECQFIVTYYSHPPKQ